MQVSECLRDIVANRKTKNGDWTLPSNFDLKIALEFDPDEDSVNMCISTGAVYITINFKASKLPDFIQFLYNNHTKEQ